MNLQFPEKLGFFTQKKARFKGAYGGRGGGKSWAIADGLLYKIVTNPNNPKRILCTRELQTSIRDSVHRLISDRIRFHKLDNIFEITDKEIRGKNNSLFIFKGLRSNTTEIKSLESIDFCWVEEAEKVSEDSWEVLTPTVRNEESEIWFSWNTGTKSDPVWRKFVETPRPDAIIVKVNWYDNPWFPDVLRKEMEFDKATDPKKYARVWEGMPADGGIFFSNFNPELLEEQPFKIPPHVGERSMFGGFDFGWGLEGYASYGQWYRDGQGVPHRILHWYKNNLTAQEQADDLFEEIAGFYFTEGVFPRQIYYDYEMDVAGRGSEDEWAPIKYFKERWKKGGQRAEAWIRANKKRIYGWQVVTDYLGLDITTLQPKMKYWLQYNHYWKNSMMNAVADPADPLDMLKCNTDHPCDDTRYALMGIRGVNGVTSGESNLKYQKILREIMEIGCEKGNIVTGW